MKSNVKELMLKKFPEFWTPTLIVLSQSKWEEYFDTFTNAVKNAYACNGCYQVTAVSKGAERCPGIPGVPAIAFMGIPVIQKKDFGWVKENRDLSRDIIIVL